MANPNWVKGMESPNPEGKPKGAKDKRWATLDYWMEKIENEWEKLSPKDRAHISVEIWKAIVARRPLPPATPEESVKRVEDLMGKALQLEETPKETSQTNAIS